MPATTYKVQFQPFRSPVERIEPGSDKPADVVFAPSAAINLQRLMTRLQASSSAMQAWLKECQ